MRGPTIGAVIPGWSRHHKRASCPGVFPDCRATFYPANVAFSDVLPTQLKLNTSSVSGATVSKDKLSLSWSGTLPAAQPRLQLAQGLLDLLSPDNFPDDVGEIGNVFKIPLGVIGWLVANTKDRDD